jgi:hypothetical protein
MSRATAHNQRLVLDFGGVISRTLFETHDLTERALGLPPGTLTWRGPFDPDTMRCGATCRPTASASATTGWRAPARSAACWARTGTAWRPSCSARAAPTRPR